MIRCESSLFGQMQRWAQAARGPRTARHQSDEAALVAFPAMFVDIVVTATDVIAGTDATVATGTAGGTITAGQPIYIDTSDSNKLKAADANASDLASTVAGIALHAATASQPIKYQTGGNITISAVLTLGKAYVLSATAGGIAPVADLTTGWRTSLIGVALSTTSLHLTLYNSLATNA